MRTSITDLPFDILFIIFNLCWENRTHRERPFPMIASHVCREWRQYALDTPSFWAIIIIRDSRLQLEKYRTWLERSEKSPLTIVLGDEPFEQRSIKNIKDIMRLIVPYSNRWKSLKIFDGPQKIIQVVFDRLLDVPMPSLTKLEVIPQHTGYWRHIPAATEWRFRPFLRGGAPNLRELSIERLSYEYIGGRFPRLTILNIVDTKIAVERPLVVAVKIQHLLSRLPHLQILRLSSAYSGPRHGDLNGIQSAHAVTPPIIHACLTELSIQAPPPIRNTIISSLILPKVQYFLDRSRDRPEEWEISLDVSFLRFLEDSRPFPNLISLRLGGNCRVWQSLTGQSEGPRNGGRLSNLAGALAGLPMLKALTFDQVHWGNGQHFHCLARVCPLLQWLTFVSCLGYKLQDMKSMLMERRNLESMSPIKRIVSCDGYICWRSRLAELEAKEWLDGALEFVYKPQSSEEPGWDYLTRVEKLI